MKNNLLKSKKLSIIREKLLFYILILTCVFNINLLAQTENVGIGTTTPDNSALLELLSTTKGFLVPRLTTIQRNAIATPAAGLLIYNTTTNQFEYNVGTPASPSWVAIASTTGLANVFGSGADGQVTYWNSSSTITGSNDLFWDYTNTRLGIGNNTARERLDLVDGGNVGAIILGSAEGTNDGTIQWDGTDFFGRKGGSWISLTSSSTITGNGTTNQMTYWSAPGVISGDNNLVWDYVNQRMGIGTSTPTSTVTLDVIGNTRIQGNLEVTGEIDPISITFQPQGSAPTGVRGKLYYNNGEDKIKLYDGSSWINVGGNWDVSGSNVYRTIGNVGIGRTTPRERLDLQDLAGDGAIIVGNTSTSYTGAIKWDGFDFYGYDGSDWISFTTGGGGGGGSSTITGFGQAGQVTVWSSTATLTGNNNLYWNNVSSRLGIGDNTPDHSLDINGNLGILGDGYINFGDTDGSSGYGFRDNAGTIEFKDNGGSWSNFSALSGGDVYRSGTGADGYVAYWTSSGTISGVSNLFWDNSNSFLGIGDNTPNHMLDVGGNIGLNAGGYLNFGDVDGLTGYGFRDNAGTLEYKNSGGNWSAFTAGGGGGNVYGTGSDTYIAFWNSSNTITGSSDLVWDYSNTMMGIGTSIPAHTLDVNGNIGMGAGDYINWGSSDGNPGYGFWDDAGIIKFKNSGGSWQNFSALAGGDVYGNGTSGQVAYWLTSSTITGNTNLFWDSGNSFLGVGDNTPDHMLDIAGNVGMNAGSYINFSDVDGAGGYGFWDDAGIIKFKNSGGNWQTFTALAGGDVYGSGTTGQIAYWLTSSTITGNTNLFWDSGNSYLGIGDNTPDHMVDVAGNIGLSASSYINFGDSDGAIGYGFRDNAGTMQFKNSAGSWTNFPTSAGDVFGSGTSGYVAFWNSSNTITGEAEFFWDATTNRLGLNDATPDHSLDVAGNIGLDASSYINFGDTDGATGYGFRDNAGTMQYKNNAGAWLSFPAASAGNVFGTGTSGYVAFWNSSSTITGETELFWDATNNRLGLNDATPDHLLDVEGNLGLATGSYINFGDVDGTTGYGFRDNLGTIEFKNSAGSWIAIPSGGNTLDESYDEGGAGNGKFIMVDAGTVGLYGSNAATFTMEITNIANGGVLSIDNAGIGNSLFINENTGLYPFVVNSDGEVGIGTSTPSAMLEIEPSGTDAISILSNGVSPTNVKFFDTDVSNYAGFAAPGDVTSSIIWKLPAADGTNGQLLRTDGSGNLSWSNAGSGSPGGTDGAVQYNDAGAFGGVAAQFYWDDVNNRLGIGTNTVNEALNINGRIGLTETTAPTDNAGLGKLFTKSSDSQLWYRDDGGTEAQLSYEYAIYEDQKAANTDGGDFVQGAWRTRTLNTEIASKGSSISLAANVITLTAGTYRIVATAPGYAVERHKARFRNTTDGTTPLLGTSERSDAGVTVTTVSHIDGIITIASTKSFELQHRCETTNNGNGFGEASNFGENEVYARVYIQKIR